jgi:hypothetical protein
MLVWCPPLGNPTGAPNTLAQVLTFGPVSAEFIRMDVISTYGSPAALGEIAFAEAVPEPGTLFPVGGGLIGLVARRRRMS